MGGAAMIIRNKKFFISVLVAFSLLLVPFITPIAADDVTVWSEKKITDTKKVWTIAFSQPLKESSIKDSTVFVEDENYRLFFTTVSLSNDKKSIIVTPIDHYQENVKYRLNISKDIVSDKGKKLEKGIILPFVVNGSDNTGGTGDTGGQTGNAITRVTFSSNSYATIVNVVSNDVVDRVTVDSSDMYYLGNNTYSAALTGVTSGTSVRIQAYDINGKRIFSKDYKVN